MSDISKIKFSGTDYTIKDSVAREEVGKKVTASGGDISNTKITTAETITTEFPAPAAGEAPKTLVGKMKKFVEDFKNWKTGVCLLGQIVNNCVTDNAKLPLSAAQGKALMDLYTVLNTNLDNFKNGINALGNYTSVNQMLKNGYYYITSEVAANYAGYLIVAGYEDSSGTIRKTQYLVQDNGFKWRTVAGTLASPTFSEWIAGITKSDFGTIVRCEKTYTENMTISVNGYTVGALAYVNIIIKFTATVPNSTALAKLSIPPSVDTIFNGIVKSEGGEAIGNYIKIDTNGYIYQTASAACKEIITSGVYPIK